MIKSVWKFGKIDEIEVVRKKVGDTFSASDERSMQLILYNDDMPVSSGSLYFENGAYHIAHICVIPEYQNKYIGDMLVRVLLFKGFNMMAERIVVAPTKSTVEFFKKYGFKSISESEMELTPQTLILEGKCGHDCSNCINRDLCK